MLRVRVSFFSSPALVTVVKKLDLRTALELKLTAERSYLDVIRPNIVSGWNTRETSVLRISRSISSPFIFLSTMYALCTPP